MMKDSGVRQCIMSQEALFEQKIAETVGVIAFPLGGFNLRPDCEGTETSALIPYHRRT